MCCVYCVCTVCVLYVLCVYCVCCVCCVYYVCCVLYVLCVYCVLCTMCAVCVQLSSSSGVKPIIDALVKGCRVIELDAWSGKNEPRVLHGLRPLSTLCHIAVFFLFFELLRIGHCVIDHLDSLFVGQVTR